MALEVYRNQSIGLELRMGDEDLFGSMEDIPCDFAVAFWGYNRACDFKGSESGDSVEIYVYLSSEVGVFIESGVGQEVIDARDYLILYVLQLVVYEVGMELK